MSEHADGPRAPVVVSARGLRKSFGQAVAVDGIDFTVHAGEAFGFLGPNGAGKSSTMRMLGAVSPPSGGSLEILGRDPGADGPEIRARLGVVPQDDQLDADLSVHENLVTYGRYFGLSRAVLRDRVAELLAFVQLTDRRDDRVVALSGGMRRRLTIARALINEPELLLLDEPTTGLDPQARHLLWERLHQLRRRGVTLLLTTHYMDEAERLCDRLVVMDGGRIVAEGAPSTLIADHAGREVLELRFAEGDWEPALAALADLPDRIEVVSDRVLVYAAHADKTVEALEAAGLHAVATLTRRASLEDVFLLLTGRTLAE